jgi:GntR family transcriptional regulator
MAVQIRRLRQEVSSTPAEAAYQTLAQDIRTAILRDEVARLAGGAGGGREDGRLPTEAELAQSYGVSRQTVRRAFQDLVTEGMVLRVPGRGTFVAPRRPYLRQFGSVEDLMGLSLDTTLELLSPLRRQVNVEAAGRLGLRSDHVSTVEFRRLHEDVPFCVTTVYLPPEVGRLLAGTPQLTRRGSRSSVTVLGLLDARLAAPITGAEQSITAVAAASPVTEHLSVSAGQPLLRVDRSYHDTDGRAVELAVSHFVPDHYSYRVRLERSAR